MLSPERYLARFTYYLSKQDWRCSYFPNGNWIVCCRAHDYACADAEARRSAKMRHQANVNLKNCVSAKGHPWVARIMYEAVEIDMEKDIKLGKLNER